MATKRVSVSYNFPMQPKDQLQHYNTIGNFTIKVRCSVKTAGKSVFLRYQCVTGPGEGRVDAAAPSSALTCLRKQCRKRKTFFNYLNNNKLLFLSLIKSFQFRIVWMKLDFTDYRTFHMVHRM